MSLERWQIKLINNKEEFVKEINSVCIIGAAKSGVAAAELAVALGKKVYLSDNKDIDTELRAKLEEQGIDVQSGAHSKEFVAQADCVVISPGVPTKLFEEKYLSVNQIFVGEIEFASWYLKTDDIIAITGTNGKTTVTTVSSELLKKYTQRPVYCLGNVGSPLSEKVLDIESNAIVCLELSSFQLETVYSFKAHIAVLLNVTADHLDRYESFDDYKTAKLKVFNNLTDNDHIINGLELEDLYDNKRFIEEIVINYGVSLDQVEEFWSNFKGLEHRREYIDTINGVRYINDSKATNVEATIWALKSEAGPVILLAGGKDKGFNFYELCPYLKNVKKLIVFGDTAAKIKEQLKNHSSIDLVDSLELATKLAYDISEDGDTVLLSPMCSSFDQFKNYMQRGHVFREQVHKLRG